MRVAFVLVCAWLSSGCGVMFQAIAGFDESRTERRTETQRIAIDSAPQGAAVMRTTFGHAPIGVGVTPVIDGLDYEVEEVIEEPASMLPFVLGVGLDALFVTATGVAVGRIDNRDDRAGAYAVWGLYMVGALVAEVVAGVIIGQREPTVKSSRFVDGPTHTYVVEMPGLTPLQTTVKPPVGNVELVAPLAGGPFQGWIPAVGTGTSTTTR